MAHDTLSPRQAATRAGCGRSSIMRALTSGHLRATRGNDGSWQITPEALDDWLSMRSPARISPDQTEDRPAGPDPNHLAEAQTRAAVAEARLADALADRDHWREMALRLSEARPVDPVPVSFWDRLFRR
jgi:hypothetical protein